VEALQHGCDKELRLGEGEAPADALPRPVPEERERSRSGRISPSKMWVVGVFPAPLALSRPTISPGFTANDRPARASMRGACGDRGPRRGAEPTTSGPVADLPLSVLHPPDASPRGDRQARFPARTLSPSRRRVTTAPDEPNRRAARLVYPPRLDRSSSPRSLRKEPWPSALGSSRCAASREPLRPEGGEQEVHTIPMAARADDEAAPERSGGVPPIEGLVEEPAATRRPGARAQLAHHRVSHRRSIRAVQIQLLHHRRAWAERHSACVEIVAQHGAVPRSDVGTVRAAGRVRPRLRGEGARVGACLKPGEQRAPSPWGKRGAGMRSGRHERREEDDQCRLPTQPPWNPRTAAPGRSRSDHLPRAFPMRESSARVSPLVPAVSPAWK